ncbi:MAG: DUF21 domain-containing protein [Planctomycetes bacterium]|nr:DUF21 domain-containing protein [Planctomycetota bacterium]
MTAFALLAGLIAALALSAFCSGTETGIYCLNRVRLRLLSDREEPAARRLAGLMERPQELVIAALLGTNIADYCATVCVTALLLRSVASESAAELYATAILTPLILVFGGIMPKDWFRRDSDRLMYRLALPLAVFARLIRATGVVWLLRQLTRTLVRRIDPRHAAQEASLLPRARTLRLLHEGAARGGLTLFQRETIERVMNISQVRVGSVMIHRQRAATVPIDIGRDDFLRIARMSHFSRLPVWRDDPKRVVGIVNVYDVLSDDEQHAPADLLREALFLQPADSVPAALLELQQARQAMAIVRDRFDNCIGILTVKDLVEEIVGDLEAW